MLRTSNFRRQHDDILALVDEIQQLCGAGINEINAETIRQNLMKLMGKVKIHLAQEDKSLYPNAVASNNKNAIVIAERFQKEMGNLSGTFISFVESWHSPSAIADNPSGFTSEASQIFAALGARIKRENEELYPIIDQL